MHNLNESTTTLNSDALNQSYERFEESTDPRTIHMLKKHYKVKHNKDFVNLKGNTLPYEVQDMKFRHDVETDIYDYRRKLHPDILDKLKVDNTSHRKFLEIKHNYEDGMEYKQQQDIEYINSILQSLRNSSGKNHIKLFGKNTKNSKKVNCTHLIKLHNDIFAPTDSEKPNPLDKPEIIEERESRFEKLSVDDLNIGTLQNTSNPALLKSEDPEALFAGLVKIVEETMDPGKERDESGEKAENRKQSFIIPSFKTFITENPQRDSRSPNMTTNMMNRLFNKVLKGTNAEEKLHLDKLRKHLKAKVFYKQSMGTQGDATDELMELLVSLGKATSLLQGNLSIMGDIDKKLKLLMLRAHNETRIIGGLDKIANHLHDGINNKTYEDFKESAIYYLSKKLDEKKAEKRVRFEQLKDIQAKYNFFSQHNTGIPQDYFSTFQYPVLSEFKEVKEEESTDRGYLCKRRYKNVNKVSKQEILEYLKGKINKYSNSSKNIFLPPNAQVSRFQRRKTVMRDIGSPRSSNVRVGGPRNSGVKGNKIGSRLKGGDVKYKRMKTCPGDTIRTNNNNQEFGAPVIFESYGSEYNPLKGVRRYKTNIYDDIVDVRVEEAGQSIAVEQANLVPHTKYERTVTYAPSTGHTNPPLIPNTPPASILKNPISPPQLTNTTSPPIPSKPPSKPTPPLTDPSSNRSRKLISHVEVKERMRETNKRKLELDIRAAQRRSMGKGSSMSNLGEGNKGKQSEEESMFEGEESRKVWDVMGERGGESWKESWTRIPQPEPYPPGRKKSERSGVRSWEQSHSLQRGQTMSSSLSVSTTGGHLSPRDPHHLPAGQLGGHFALRYQASTPHPLTLTSTNNLQLFTAKTARSPCPCPCPCPTPPQGLCFRMDIPFTHSTSATALPKSPTQQINFTHQVNMHRGITIPTHHFIGSQSTAGSMQKRPLSFNKGGNFTTRTANKKFDFPLLVSTYATNNPFIL